MLDQLNTLHAQAEFACEIVDVDGDEDLQARYHDRVPVLESGDGYLLCEVFLDPIKVLNYLQDA
jgi:hypothetical protein